jgi:hypothetical protein
VSVCVSPEEAFTTVTVIPVKGALFELLTTTPETVAGKGTRLKLRFPFIPSDNEIGSLIKVSYLSAETVNS